jgi:hypothetical protein
VSQKTLQKNRAGGVAQGEGPEFKPQYRKKGKNLKKESKNGKKERANNLSITVKRIAFSPFVTLH